LNTLHKILSEVLTAGSSHTEYGCHHLPGMKETLKKEKKNEWY